MGEKFHCRDYSIYLDVNPMLGWPALTCQVRRPDRSMSYGGSWEQLRQLSNERSVVELYDHDLGPNYTSTTDISPLRTRSAMSPIKVGVRLPIERLVADMDDLSLFVMYAVHQLEVHEILEDMSYVVDGKFATMRRPFDPHQSHGEELAEAMHRMWETRLYGHGLERRFNW